MLSFESGFAGLGLVVLSFLLYYTDKREEQLQRERDCLCHLQDFQNSRMMDEGIKPSDGRSRKSTVELAARKRVFVIQDIFHFCCFIYVYFAAQDYLY